MKVIKSLLAAGLSALLVAGAALPALAAEDALKKDETVYVVMEPDGSLRSQTVSAHLHRETGLGGVTDQSSLTAIENTHDLTEFTQNGQELSWDTDGTDVYYKGETERKAPIQARITYELDGKTVDPEELPGKSGHLKLTVKLENTETGAVEIQGKSMKICTPFAAMTAIVLGEGWGNISAPHGRVTGAGNTQAVAFACLPGVRECLEEIGSDKLEELEDHLIDELVVEGDVTGCALPDILIACATDTETLRENGFSGLEKLDGLDDDIRALREGMDELLDGAGQLADGAAALESGAAALVDGANSLSSGAQQLNGGTAELQTGAWQLNAGAAEARDGAAALQAGAGSLSAGLADLQNGAGALANGYTQLKKGSESLSAGLATLQGNSKKFTDGMHSLTEGIAALYAAVGADGALTAGAKGFGEALGTAASNSAAAVGQLPDPSAFASSPLAEDPAYQQLLAAYSGAYSAAQSMAGGLGELNGAYAQVQGGLRQVSDGVGALQAGVSGNAGLSAGLAAYTQGVDSAAAGAVQLDGGLAQLGGNLPALTEGVNRLVSGSNQLSAGAGALSQGNAALADGAAKLAQGTDALAAGGVELSSGAELLAQGAARVYEGSGQLRDGTQGLQDGLVQFDDQGISKLTGAFDTEKLPMLREMTTAMRQRLEDYGSFAGAPEGAEVTTRFVMKAAVPVQENKPEEDSAPEETQEQEGLWQRIVGLFTK